MAEKPSFRAAFKAKPCLVVADGFYEWARVGPKEKQPYFITAKGTAPFAFAGLWEWWRAKEAPKEEPAPTVAKRVTRHGTDGRRIYSRVAWPFGISWVGRGR